MLNINVNKKYHSVYVIVFNTKLHILASVGLQPTNIFIIG